MDLIVVIGALLVGAGIGAFGAGFHFDRDSVVRWRLNWWSIVLLYVGLTVALTSKLV